MAPGKGAGTVGMTARQQAPALAWHRVEAGLLLRQTGTGVWADEAAACIAQGGSCGTTAAAAIGTGPCPGAGIQAQAPRSGSSRVSSKTKRTREKATMAEL